MIRYSIRLGKNGVEGIVFITEIGDGPNGPTVRSIVTGNGWEAAMGLVDLVLEHAHRYGEEPSIDEYLAYAW